MLLTKFNCYWHTIAFHPVALLPLWYIQFNGVTKMGIAEKDTCVTKRMLCLLKTPACIMFDVDWCYVNKYRQWQFLVLKPSLNYSSSHCPKSLHRCDSKYSCYYIRLEALHAICWCNWWNYLLYIIEIDRGRGRRKHCGVVKGTALSFN